MRLCITCVTNNSYKVTHVMRLPGASRTREVSTGEDQVASQHTVTRTKVTYDAKGNPTNTETLSSGPCNCGASSDHTNITQSVYER